MTTPDVQLDPSKTEAFGAQMVGLLNSAALALMTSIGHRTKLFDHLATLPSSTSQQIADQAGLNERYVREWLGAMVTGGVVEYDPTAQTYALPPEHAAWLTRAASANNLAASTQFISVLGNVEDEILDAFRHGRGVPYSSYRRFHEVMAEESNQTIVSGLLEFILPLDPGLIPRLERGIDVLDVGCGAGRAMLRLAEHFPSSRFLGIDFADEAIAAAQAQADALGLSNIRFEVRDAAELSARQAFDLITAFDAIHDQARPADVLRSIAQALRPDGLFLMQEISGSGHLHHDIDHPCGAFLYSISCLHCMSVSLAHGGPGLGAMWGRELALEMLRAAGFKSVRVESLPHDVMNFYYLATLE